MGLYICLRLMIGLCASLALIGCGRSRWIPPTGHTDADIAWDVAYCEEKNRERLVMQGERVDPDECLIGRGWRQEPTR